MGVKYPSYRYLLQPEHQHWPDCLVPRGMSGNLPGDSAGVRRCSAPLAAATDPDCVQNKGRLWPSFDGSDPNALLPDGTAQERQSLQHPAVLGSWMCCKDRLSKSSWSPAQVRATCSAQAAPRSGRLQCLTLASLSKHKIPTLPRALSQCTR